MMDEANVEWASIDITTHSLDLSGQLGHGA